MFLLFLFKYNISIFLNFGNWFFNSYDALCTCYVELFVCVAYPVQLLQVDVLVAEAIEAYKIGELQPEVQFLFISIPLSLWLHSIRLQMQICYWCIVCHGGTTDIALD